MICVAMQTTSKNHSFVVYSAHDAALCQVGNRIAPKIPGHLWLFDVLHQEEWGMSDGDVPVSELLLHTIATEGHTMIKTTSYIATLTGALAR